MPSFTASIPAATAVLGADLFADQVWARSPGNRTLNGIGCKGSAAAGDSEFEVYIDEVRVGQFFNLGTGFPNNDDITALESLGVPAGAQLRAIVRDAAATNPLNVTVELENV
mgnify:CR=1 FL=1|jgi:hypothetical protein